MHDRDLKPANVRVQETEQSIDVAQQSLEQHRAKVVEIERSLQERRNHLHLPQEARDCLRKAADLYEEERKAEAAAKEAAARPAKEAMKRDEFGDLEDRRGHPA